MRRYWPILLDTAITGLTAEYALEFHRHTPATNILLAAIWPLMIAAAIAAHRAERATRNHPDTKEDTR